VDRRRCLVHATHQARRALVAGQRQRVHPGAHARWANPRGAVQVDRPLHRRSWRDDLVHFHFILDGKLPDKLAAGEKDLDVLLVPLLGSNDYELVVPNTWGDEPVHPFAAKFFEPSENVSLNRIFEHGLRFEPSHEHAGLQLVDVVAYVTRRAILEPDNDVIHRAYAHLRDNLRTERDGQALRLVSGGGGREQEIDDYRYRLVL
jgi:hypothetical protein